MAAVPLLLPFALGGAAAAAGATYAAQHFNPDVDPKKNRALNSREALAARYPKQSDKLERLTRTIDIPPNVVSWHRSVFLGLWASIVVVAMLSMREHFKGRSFLLSACVALTIAAVTGAQMFADDWTSRRVLAPNAAETQTLLSLVLEEHETKVLAAPAAAQAPVDPKLLKSVRTHCFPKSKDADSAFVAAASAASAAAASASAAFVASAASDAAVLI